MSSSVTALTLGSMRTEREFVAPPAERLAVVAVVGCVIEAVGIGASVWALESWLPMVRGIGWVFWTFPALGVLVAALLLPRPSTRAYGWAVLLGTVAGFAAFVAYAFIGFALADWD